MILWTFPYVVKQWLISKSHLVLPNSSDDVKEFMRKEKWNRDCCQARLVVHLQEH